MTVLLLLMLILGCTQMVGKEKRAVSENDSQGSANYGTESFGRQAKQQMAKSAAKRITESTVEQLPQPITDSPEQTVLFPEVQYPEADGAQGYYRFYPEIRIQHKDPDAMTGYLLLAADGSRTEGILELQEEEETAEILLEKDRMSEGENILYVWMERKSEYLEKPVDGEVLFYQEFSFPVDTQSPGEITFGYGCVVNGDILFAKDPVEISIRSRAEDSDIQKICYRAGSEEYYELPAEGGIVVLQPGFLGRVEAYAEDYAGNQSKHAVSHEVVCENLAPEIQMQTERGFDAWHTGSAAVSVQVAENPQGAGIRSVKCYVGGQVLVQREIGQSREMYLEINFTVEQAAEGGRGVPVVIEVMDWAGNYRVETRTISIDIQAPEIQWEGIHDQMISAEKISGRLRIEEENVLAFTELEIQRTAPSGEQEQMDLPGADHPDQGRLSQAVSPQREWDILLTEDGIYELHVTAEDLAGHRIERRYRVTVDKTSPVIRYVDQMQGVYLPYFQWNYSMEEMFWDFTEYSYEMRLDGRFYAPGRKVTEEGIHLLQVTAKDAAGNRSTAEAVFQIDHTPPRIRIYDVEDGKTYEETVTLSIAVDGKGERLSEIRMNSEKMRLEEECRIFQRSFQEPGDYQVEVQAEDLAGNKESGQISFRIEEKQSAADLWKPVKKIFQREEESKGNAVEPEKENRSQSGVLAWGAGGTCLLAVVVLFGRRKGRRR